MNSPRVANDQVRTSHGLLSWQSLAWVFAVLIVVVILAFVALCLVPYFANGIYRLPAADITGGAYDARKLPPYNWVHGNGVGYPLLLGAGLSWVGVQFAMPVLAIVVMIISTLQRRRMPTSENIALSVIAIVGCIFTILASTVFFNVLHWLAGSP